MEDDVWELFNAGIAVELLVPTSREACTCVGIRLRPYSKKLRQGVMVLASGETFVEALSDAIAKAQNGRWERLDWSARPWETAKGPGGGQYGL